MLKNVAKFFPPEVSAASGRASVRVSRSHAAGATRTDRPGNRTASPKPLLPGRHLVVDSRSPPPTDPSECRALLDPLHSDSEMEHSSESSRYRMGTDEERLEALEQSRMAGLWRPRDNSSSSDIVPGIVELDERDIDSDNISTTLLVAPTRHTPKIRQPGQGPLRYARNNRLVRVQKYEFTAYAEPWSTTGIPFDTLPDGVSYICGKPEYNTTTDPLTGKQRQHFQGVVVMEDPTEWQKVESTLGLTGDIWCAPISNTSIKNRIEYTKKKETAVLNSEGFMMWKELGELKANDLRAGDIHREILKMAQSGATLGKILEFWPAAVNQIFQIMKLIEIYNLPVDRPNLQVYLLYGSTGTGKTWTITQRLEPGIYNKPHPKGNNTDFWMGYTGEEAVLFDDFHPSRYPMMDLLNYLQEYAMRVPIKGGHHPAMWKRVYISTNVPITSWYEREQNNPNYSENYAALLRRIPPENRVKVKGKLPANIRVKNFAQYKAYQESLEDPTPVAQPVTSRSTEEALGGKSREELIQIIKGMMDY